jgi:hypothetical protein
MLKVYRDDPDGKDVFVLPGVDGGPPQEIPVTLVDTVARMTPETFDWIPPKAPDGDAALAKAHRKRYPGFYGADGTFKRGGTYRYIWEQD